MLLTAAILGATIAYVGQSVAEEGVESRWRREYPSAVRKLESQAQSFSAGGRFSYHFFDGTVERSASFTIASSGGAKLIKKDGRGLLIPNSGGLAPAPSLVLCETFDHIFVLVKPDKADQYRIDEFGAADRSDPDSVLASEFASIANASTAYMAHSLITRTQDPTFKLHSAGEVIDGGRKLIRLAYEAMMDGRDESGSVHLDPSLGWVIRKVDISFRTGDGSEVALQIIADYPDTDPLPFLPARLEHTIRAPRSDSYQQMVVDLDDIHPGKPPETMFRLSGYGLPEIPLSPEPGPTFYTWSNPLLWGAFAAAVVSFVLLWSLPWRARAETT